MELKALDRISKAKDKMIDNLKNENIRLKEAIAELEALQAPKTCGGYAECENASAIHCSMCIRYHNYSDYYEPKGSE